MSSAGQPPTTVTIDDTGNDQNWTTITNSYDCSGFLVATNTIMDNGSTVSETFFGPQRLSLTVTDTSANNANWASRTTEWNWQGQKTARTIEYDNGDERIERFDAVTGTRTQRTDIDGNDDKPWTSITTSYDAATGARIGSEKVLDNGRIETLTFDADTGVRTSRTLTDGGNDNPWQSKSLTYDANTGQLTERETVFDDGRTDTITYQNGKKASQVLTDGDNDTFDWVTRETTYDANGRLALAQEVRDDGDLVVETYAGGRLTGQTTFDNSGNEAWHVEEVTFNTAGDVVDTTYYDESGNLLIF
ncbi:hypothetical protein GCM10007385_13560 [Tateyamaria omphalii]|uniref:hypothetical protein n=1 Tax=Tateyamaria omphalii TaxID=299262 RepID=UPI00167BACC7|nr:hypothetical protein [Tateyamaria omphalii]GGX47094.1 hypothetical protein GCM10007385_13560 [Tateyamaria omphalii]